MPRGAFSHDAFYFCIWMRCCVVYELIDCFFNWQWGQPFCSTQLIPVMLTLLNISRTRDIRIHPLSLLSTFLSSGSIVAVEIGSLCCYLSPYFGGTNGCGKFSGCLGMICCNRISALLT